MEAVPLPFEPSLSVVVPTYNERDNLPAVLGEVLAFLPRACRRFELVVVDDGSTDDSQAVISSRPEVRVIRHARNLGLTAALRTGFGAAAQEFVTWLPADGQIAPAELGKMLAAWRGEDLLLSTYHHRPDGLSRTVMSRSLRLLLYLATGFRDRLEGPYLFRRCLLDELELVARTSAGSIGLEIGAKARAFGKQIGSTEIECSPRRSGSSKVVSARNIVAYLGELWRIRRSLQALAARRRSASE
jgi:glycosyltransferase involved in cell wall biosynthesis